VTYTRVEAEEAGLLCQVFCIHLWNVGYRFQSPWPNFPSSLQQHLCEKLNLVAFFSGFL